MTNAMQRLAAAGVLIGALALGQNASAQIDVDVDITLGSITILYSFTDIQVDIDSTTLGTLFTPAGCTAGALGSQECDSGIANITPAVSAGALNADANINPAALTNVSAVPLTLNNVWAVRAIGGTTANTTVGITGTGDATLDGPSGSIISVSNIAVTGGSFADPGLGNPTRGGVSMDLDFSQVTDDGLHDGAGAAFLYTIEVTGT